MMTKITVIKKTVRYNNKLFKLTYYLLLKDDFHYGIRVDCCDGNTIETEHLWTGQNRQATLSLLYRFAKETVFPIALKETFENI